MRVTLSYPDAKKDVTYSVVKRDVMWWCVSGVRQW